MKLTLTRVSVQRNAVIGTLDVPGRELPFWTLEDIWRGNKTGDSCIPSGTYHCKPHGWRGEPVKFKQVWKICNVPNRSAILLHAGNSDLDTHGCVLIGTGVSRGMLTESQAALKALRELLYASDFELQIIDLVQNSDCSLLK